MRVCSFKSAPGLYVVPGALSTAHQAQLATHAYTTLSHPKYDCSLQNTVRLPATGTLLQHWLRSLRPATGGEGHGGCAAPGASGGHLVPDEHASPRLEPMPLDAPGIERMVRRLRWIALGYRYDWSSLSYDWKEQPQPLPPCIVSLAHDTVELLRQMPVGLQCGVYRPQAAVVNFYQIFDSLTSHVDRSEPAAGAPLVSAPCVCAPSHRCLCNSILRAQVSLSLGCPAVFLFGGESREDDALALLLRSGDVLVMVRWLLSCCCPAHCSQLSREQADSARRCFHGVPRVLELPHALSPPSPLPLRPTLPKSSQPCRDADSDAIAELSEWNLIQQLLQNSRININIRQVDP